LFLLFTHSLILLSPSLQIGDVAALYLKYNENCGEMLVQEGLMDRDLGTENWDSVMTSFINKYLVATVVSKSSDMDQHVDIKSYLKTTAFLGVMLSEDSVLGTTNNYYMAQTGDDSGFKMIAFDHNIGSAQGASKASEIVLCRVSLGKDRTASNCHRGRSYRV
jgi:hypothetical protein